MRGRLSALAGAVQCLSCLNTITEVRLAASPTVARNERLSGYAGSAGVAKVQKLSDISLEELPRFPPDLKSSTAY